MIPPRRTLALVLAVGPASLAVFVVGRQIVEWIGDGASTLAWRDRTVCRAGECVAQIGVSELLSTLLFLFAAIGAIFGAVTGRARWLWAAAGAMFLAWMPPALARALGPLPQTAFNYTRINLLAYGGLAVLLLAAGWLVRTREKPHIIRAASG